MTTHDHADAENQPSNHISTTETKAVVPTAEMPPMTGSLNWEAPDLIHTYQDVDGNLIMPAAWRDEGDDEDDNLYT